MRTVLKLSITSSRGYRGIPQRAQPAAHSRVLHAEPRFLPRVVEQEHHRGDRIRCADPYTSVPRHPGTVKSVTTPRKGMLPL